MYVCMCAGEPIVPGEMCVLEIHKQHNSLGLRIVGGVETQLVSRSVHQVVVTWSRLGLGRTAALVLPLLTPPGSPSLPHSLPHLLTASPFSPHHRSPSMTLSLTYHPSPLPSPPLTLLHTLPSSLSITFPLHATPFSPPLLSPSLPLLPSPPSHPLVEGHLYPRHPKGHSSLCRLPTVSWRPDHQCRLCQSPGGSP